MLGLYISNYTDPLGYFQRGLAGDIIETLIISPAFKSKHALWLKIKSQNPDFIILNLDIAFVEESSPALYEGVKFLQYVRMMGFTKCCLLFGQKPLSELIKSSLETAILFSNGNNYFVPFQDKLEEVEFSTLLTIQADNSNLYEIAKVCLDIERVRHEWANYWGIYSLFNAHKLLDKNDKDISSILPESLKTKLVSFEGVSLKYLYQKNGSVNEIELASKINYCNILRNKLNNSSPKILYIDDQANYGWSEVLQEIIYGCKNSLFKTIRPEINFNEERLIQKLCDEIIKFEPHFLLLDIRLRNEKGLFSNPNDFFPENVECVSNNRCC